MRILYACPNSLWGPANLGCGPDFQRVQAPIVRLGAARGIGNSTASNLQVELPKKPHEVGINMFHDVLEQ